MFTAPFPAILSTEHMLFPTFFFLRRRFGAAEERQEATQSFGVDGMSGHGVNFQRLLCLEALLAEGTRHVTDLVALAWGENVTECYKNNVHNESKLEFREINSAFTKSQLLF
jgi:hypothetical protein